MHICILYETAAVTMSEIYAVHIHYNIIIYIFYHFVYIDNVYINQLYNASVHAYIHIYI